MSELDDDATPLGDRGPLDDDRRGDEVPVEDVPARRETNPRRILNWLAAGLVLVSVSTGILHHVHYRKVGNQVTALLPRETVAYIRIGNAASIADRLASLDLWANSRPVRALIQGEEDAFLDASLYDLNINRRLLESLEVGTAAIHVALVDAGEGRVDTLVFLEVVDAEAHKELERRVLSTFEPVESVGDAALRRHRGVGRPLWAATADRMAIFSTGREETIRSVLQNRGNSPKRTLSDSEAFRSAWLANRDGSDVFAYARADRLRGWMDAALGPDGNAGALLGSIARTVISEALSAGLAIDLTQGTERTRLAFHVPAEGLALLHDETGIDRQKSTLAVIPATASFAVALAVHRPEALFERARPWVLAALAHATGANASAMSSELNRIQAETGRLLAREVWPRIAGEVAVAFLPGPGRGIDWLVVARAYQADLLAQAAADLILAWLESNATGGAPRVSFAQGFHRVTDSTGDRVCLAVSGDVVLVGSTCDAVGKARTAEQSGDGLSELPSVAEALSALPERTTAVAVARLRETMVQIGFPKRLTRLIGERFLVTAALSVTPDVAEIVANLSPLALGLLGLSNDREVPRPELCDRLFATVCPAPGDDKTCERYASRLKSMNADTCARALNAYGTIDAQVKGPG